MLFPLTNRNVVVVAQVLCLGALITVCSCNTVVKVSGLRSESLDQFAVGTWQGGVGLAPGHESATLDTASRNVNYNLEVKADKTFTFYGEGSRVTGKWLSTNKQLALIPTAVDGKSPELVRREGKVYESLARFHVQSSSEPPLDPTPIQRARALNELEDMGSLTPGKEENRMVQARSMGDLQVYFTRRA